MSALRSGEKSLWPTTIQTDNSAKNAKNTMMNLNRRSQRTRRIHHYLNNSFAAFAIFVFNFLDAPVGLLINFDKLALKNGIHRLIFTEADRP
jgi:hypothetical protein